MTVPADQTILAFDTSAGHCAAAVIRGNAVLCEMLEPMKRGQAERLMGLITETLEAAKVNWQDLDAIAVGVGPGNFTGIRISVAAARGLSLSLNIPAIGITNFDAIAEIHPKPALAAVPAPRDQVYIQPIHSAGTHAPYMAARADVEEEALEIIFFPDNANPACAMAKAASARTGGTHPAPAPLYIKAADAAPARDAPPTVIP